MLILWRRYKVLYLVILSVSSLDANALEMTYTLGSSIARHDNINLVANPVSEEWVTTLNGGLILIENSPSLTANVNANIAALYYKNKQQQDATVGGINAIARWIIKPRQFEWFFSDVLSQTAIDPLQSNTLTNRQDTNSFLTGPNYFWRIDSRHNINFEARVGKVNFTNSVGNNDRTTSAVRWLYQANRSTTNSINWEVENLNFTDANVTDYSRQNLYARINYIRARNTYTAEAGVTNIKYASQAQQGGQRYLVSIQNQRTRNSNIQFTYSHRITDTGTALLTAPSTTQTTPNATSILSPAGDIYTDDRLTFIYTRNTTTGSLLVNLSNSIQDYRTQNNFDVDSTVVSILPRYNFSQISSLSMEASQTLTKYKNVTPKRTDTDSRLRVIYNYNSGRNVVLSLAATHMKRDSTDVARNYENNNIMLTFTYSSR